MTGFTHMHLPLVSDYSQVLSIQQDSLSRFSYYSQAQKCVIGVTRKYFQLVSNRSQAVYFSCHTSPTRELSSNFLRHELRYSHFFVNLDVSCTVWNTQTGKASPQLIWIHSLSACMPTNVPAVNFQRRTIKIINTFISYLGNCELALPASYISPNVPTSSSGNSSFSYNFHYAWPIIFNQVTLSFIIIPMDKYLKWSIVNKTVLVYLQFTTSNNIETAKCFHTYLHAHIHTKMHASMQHTHPCMHALNP